MDHRFQGCVLDGSGSAREDRGALAADLTVRGVDPPLPAPVALRNHICGTPFPLAEDGAKLLAEPTAEM